MKKNYLTWILILLLIVVGVLVSIQISHQPKIVFVRSNELIEKYQGTLAARADFEKKKNSMTANVDSLNLDFERAKNRYAAKVAQMSVMQRKEQETILAQQHNQLEQYSSAIDAKIREEDTRMMQEVLNQINSYIEQYAREKDIDVVLGTTNSGSLLYGVDSMDITDQLLIELNSRYQGKK